MSKSKCLTSGIIAACLLMGTGNVLFADGTKTSTPAEAKATKKRAAAKVAASKRGHHAASPARPSGIGTPPDAGPGYDTSGKINEYRNELGQTVYAVSASQFDISPPLSEMAAAAPPEKGVENEDPSNPVLPLWRIPHSNEPDPVVQSEIPPMSFAKSPFPSLAPSTGFNFQGVGQSGGVPPDTNGAVGNNQFFEVVNTRYQVWTITRPSTVTSLVGPTNINSFWSGFGGPCQTQNAGDPIVLYDKLADRWLVSQFTSAASSGSYYQCVAVSTTANAAGTYARWAFQVPSGRFGDYPHFGLWTDAYYMMAHAFTAASGGTYVAGIFAAMDRTKMLAGDASATWQVILDTNEGGHMPADLDGFAPPPTGAPGIFLSLHSPSMFVYRMKVDFVTPANTVKTLQASIPVAASTAACFGSTTGCVPQPGTTRLLDSLSDRLMYRAAYRNFIDHESVVISHSVDPSVTGLVAAVRWYDFRLSGTPNGVCSTYPCIYQQGTIADAANGRNRWMPSLAMDGAENIIVGYSVSGKTANTENHSIRYTGRAKGDPLGTMTVAEATIITGTKNNTSNTRWGDYASMSADPFDDCTLWYATEYYTVVNSWLSRISSASWPAGTGAGQCQPTTCVNATRPASAPTIGTATAVAPNQIQVTWTGIAPQPGAYAIERAVGACGSEGLYQPLAAALGTDSSFIDTNVQGGLTYSYKVVAATDAAGKCQSLLASSCASATASGNCTLKPTFTGAASGSSNGATSCGVNVSWTPAVSNCPLTPNVRYNIFRGTVPDFVPSLANRIASCVTSAASYLDTNNLTSGATYYYVVRAEDNSTVNGGECGGGNEESNGIVVSGTAYGVGTQPAPGTWTDSGGDGTAFLQLNVVGTGDTSHQSWRFVKTTNDAGANHTAGGSYAYRNAGPTGTDTYSPSVCAETDTPTLTVGATSTTLQYWERHQLEYHWDGVAVEFQKNGGAWTDVPAPSASTAAGCLATDTTTNWETLSCTGSPAANACGYAATKNVIDGPLGSGTACASWVTNATVPAYVHRCHPITGLVSGDTLRFRWRFASDSSANYAGFYLDDIAVTNTRLPNTCTTDTCFGQADGAACNDGNACTQTDTCQSGRCVGGNSVVCSASDTCHDAGTCDSTTGSCSNPVKSNGSTCDDGNLCTYSDVCTGGVCGGTPITCTDNQCNFVTCNGSSTCTVTPKTNGTTCNDGFPCTQTDTCQGGVCIGSNPLICNDNNACTDDSCNPATGTCQFIANDGNTCTDNNVCTTDACSGGNCVYSPSGVCGATGSVFYYRSSVNPGTEPTVKPVPSVEIDANSDASADATTDGTGGYSLSNLTGHVTLAPLAKYGSGYVADNNGAISSLDASLIARTAVGNASMSPNQTLAGDVTGNGTLSGLDASQVARYSVGLVQHFDVGTATGSDWKFLRCDAYAYPGAPGCGPALYDYNPIAGPVSGQNFYAILYGEVTGNWQPAGAFAAAVTTRVSASPEELEAVKADRIAADRFRDNPPVQVVRAAGRAPATLTLHGWTTAMRAGERRQLTIDLRNADGILAVDLSLKYDPSQIAVVAVASTGIGSGLTIAHGDLDGTHKISAYGMLPLSGSGSVMTVTIEAVKPTGLRLPLTVVGTANEGRIPLQVRIQTKSLGGTR